MLFIYWAEVSPLEQSAKLSRIVISHQSLIRTRECPCRKHFVGKIGSPTKKSIYRNTQMNYIRLMIDELTLFGIFAITFTLIIVGQGTLKLSFDTLVFFVIFLSNSGESLRLGCW